MPDWAELAERGVAAYDALDAEAFAALCTDDVEVVPLIGAVEGGEPYRGAAGIAVWFRELAAAFASIETVVERVHDLGDAGVVELRGRNRGRASGAEIDTRTFGAMRRWGEALCWFSSHPDRDAAARALGFPSLNVALVMRHHQAWLGRDYEGAVAMMAPDMEFDASAFTPDGAPGRGVAAAAAMTRRWWEDWEQWRFEPQEYVGAGDRVLVRTHFAGRGKRSGVYLEHDFFEVLTFDDARVVRFEMIRDEAQARTAAGLSPRQSE